MKLIAFSIFSAVVSFWIWRLFLTYPWADIMALFVGAVIFVTGYVSNKKNN